MGEKNMCRRRKSRKIISWFISLTVLIGLLVYGGVNKYYPVQYMDIINKYSREYGFTSEFVCAVIHAESKFKEETVSNKGASGLMQITEHTAYWLAQESELESFQYDQIFDPEINIRLGCYYLNRLIKQYDSLEVALSAYNAGSGNVTSWLDNSEFSDDGKTLKYIPFQETRDYVKRISANQKVYAFILKVKNLFSS